MRLLRRLSFAALLCAMLCGCLDTSDSADPATDPPAAVLQDPLPVIMAPETLPLVSVLPIDGVAGSELVEAAVNEARARSEAPGLDRPSELPMALYDCLEWGRAGRDLAAVRAEGKSLAHAIEAARATTIGQMAEAGSPAVVVPGGVPGFAEFLARTVYYELDGAPTFAVAASLFQLCRAERAAAEDAVMPGSVLGRLVNEGHQIKAAVALLKAHRATDSVEGPDPTTLADLAPAYLGKLPQSWVLELPIDGGLAVTGKPLAALACADVNAEAGLTVNDVTVDSAVFGCVDKPGAAHFNRLFFRF